MEHKGDPEYWENRYKAGDKPWDTGTPSPELAKTVEALGITGRALDVGCGTGTNAIWMAEQGLDVVAVDIAPTVIVAAREKAEKAGVKGLEIVEGDFFKETPYGGGGFDFVYDRGAFHHHADEPFRKAFAERVWRALKPGGHWLTLCGSTDDEGPGGPPRFSAADIVTAAEPWFLILDLRALEATKSGEGRLGWSALMRRRERD
ncbi:MAG: class I SAM-dependent methyltransferase [Planctomycetota bacterium]|jgi:SAM-dependent methyltransferase